jgi:CheY-like chemotaxis protein
VFVDDDGQGTGAGMCFAPTTEVAGNDATNRPPFSATPCSNPHRATVIVADDDDDTRELMTEILRTEGFEVLGACDGHEALCFAGYEPRPAAMLLDVAMPRMGGREVLRRLRGRPELASLPVCIVSSERELPTDADLAVRKPLPLHGWARVIEWLRQCVDATRRLGTAT